MHLGIPRERSTSEQRIAGTPATIGALRDLGFAVTVEAGAGAAAGFRDDDFTDAGARVVADLADVDPVDVLLCVSPPDDGLIARIAPGGAVIGFLDPAANSAMLERITDAGVTPVAMELIPRTTLAQAMDALSSQATAGGYAAVLAGASALPKFLPMLVTAAGTVPPGKVLVLGVGVAGLQAIATARRLGAIVHAYDIRPETREQVESLGAKFVDAPTQEMDEGGYARAVDEDLARRQREVLASAVADADLVITTAQVPGRTAPRLIDRDMVRAMRSGSVIIDMAASSGGNVEGSAPDAEVDIDGIRVLGPTDLPSRVATDASRMYARNLVEVVTRMVVDGQLVIDPDDAVVGPAIARPGGAP